jgi:hypothetical protein
MEFLYLLLALVIGLVLGVNLALRYVSFKVSKNEADLKSKHESVYQKVLNNILNGSAKFVSRINNAVQIGTNIPDHGDVSVIYFLDRKEVAIFKEQDCLYTTSMVNAETVDSISRAVWSKYANKINDTISILGHVYDKQSFVKMYGNVFDPTTLDLNQFSNEPTDQPLDLDDILDKINKVGYDNLSDVEKQFLKNLK